MTLHFRVLFGFMIKEFLQILHDRKMLVVIFFIPIVQTVMFGFALTSEVKNIEFIVVSKPSPIAREIEDRALASGWFKEVRNISSEEEGDPSQIILAQKAEVVLVAPKEGLEYALEHTSKPIQLLINAINAQRAQQVEGYVKQIIAQVALQNGYEVNQSMIELDTRVMFNHYMDTSDFMIPALMVMATFIVTMIICGMSIAKEKETGTMEKLIASPASPLEILLGKTFPYFIIGIIVVLFVFFIGLFVFGVPFRGQWWQIIITASLEIACALSLAALFSCWVKTQQQSMMAAVLFLLPGILLSGVFFPVSNIPHIFRWICYLNPLMYSVVNFRNLMLKGGDLIFFGQYSFISFIFCIVYVLVAFKSFKSKLN